MAVVGPARYESGWGLKQTVMVEVVADSKAAEERSPSARADSRMAAVGARTEDAPDIAGEVDTAAAAGNGWAAGNAAEEGADIEVGEAEKVVAPVGEAPETAGFGQPALRRCVPHKLGIRCKKVELQNRTAGKSKRTLFL